MIADRDPITGLRIEGSVIGTRPARDPAHLTSLSTPRRSGHTPEELADAFHDFDAVADRRRQDLSKGVAIRPSEADHGSARTIRFGKCTR